MVPVRQFLFIRETDERSSTLHLFSAEDVSNRASYQFSAENGGLPRWLEGRTLPSLAVEERHHLFELTTERKTFFADIPTDTVWYVDAERSLWLYRPHDRVVLTPDRDQAFSYQGEYPITSFLHINANRIIARTEQGMIIISLRGDAEKAYLTLPTSDIGYHAGTKEWLASSPWELWSIHPDDAAAPLNRPSEQRTAIRRSISLSAHDYDTPQRAGV